MKLVVDTNIVFSAMISPKGVAGELMLFTWPRLELFAPEDLRVELSKHRDKAVKASKLSVDEVVELEGIVLGRITVVPHAVVPTATWERAYDLVKDIDEDDDQFVALALHLNCPLWTGDGKLVRGLRRKGFKLLVTNDDLRKELGV